VGRIKGSVKRWVSLFFLTEHGKNCTAAKGIECGRNGVALQSWGRKENNAFS
jgi:hypothetical protein